MTASLAKDVALDGITANTVSPGTIRKSPNWTRPSAKSLRHRALRRMHLGLKSNRRFCRMFAEVPMGGVGDA